jgi:hypothetical protein
MILLLLLFYIPISAFIFKFIIISNSSLVFISWLYTLYKLAINIIFTILSLILNYPSFKFTVIIYKSLPIKYPLFYIICNPYIPIWSSNEYYIILLLAY